MKQKSYFQVTGILFAVIAILHGLRLLTGWNVVIGEWTVPVWASLVAIVMAGYLAYSAFILGK